MKTYEILNNIVIVTIFSLFTITPGYTQSIELISVNRVMTGSYLINDPVEMIVSSDGQHGFVLSRENRCILVIDFMADPPKMIDQINLPIQRDSLDMNMACNPVRGKLYIPDRDTNTIYIVDTSQLHATIEALTVESPMNMAVSPDGDYLYVVSSGNPCQMNIIDLTCGLFIHRVSLPENFEPEIMKISNEKLYIAGLQYENSQFLGSLYQLNIDPQSPLQYQITQHKIFSENIGAIAIHPDKQSLYVAYDSPSGKISALDVNDFSILKSIEQKKETEFSKNPKDMLICRNDLYVVNSGENSIACINIQDNTLSKQFTLNGERPVRLHVSPDEQYLYVLSQDSGSVDIVKINRYYQVIVETPGKSTGKVLINPGEIECIDRYESTYLENTSICLLASPHKNYTFTGWMTDQCGSSNPCSLSVVSDAIIQANFAKLPSYKPSAILVAGGESNDLSWDVIEKCVGYAYNSLLYQGYEKENIVLMSQKNTDYDGNGILDDVDGGATKTILFQELNRLKNHQHVLLYMMGHGTAGTFNLNGEAQLLASELRSAITHMTGEHFIIVIDSCYSGSFIAPLIMPSGQGPDQMIVITSTDNDENAIVSQKGVISFSHLFYSYIFGGASLKKAFDAASAGMSSHQRAQINSDNDDIPNEKLDRFNVMGHYIGLGKGNLTPLPEIKVSEEDIVKTGEHSAMIHIQCVAYQTYIQNMTAIIKPPNVYRQDDGQFISFPTLTLTGPGQNNNYTALYHHFCQSGLYEIQIIAVNKDGMVSIPVETVYYQESDYVSQFSNAIITRENSKLLDIIKALQIMSGSQVGIHLQHPCEKVKIRDAIGLMKRLSKLSIK